MKWALVFPYFKYWNQFTDSEQKIIHDHYQGRTSLWKGSSKHLKLELGGSTLMLTTLKNTTEPEYLNDAYRLM